MSTSITTKKVREASPLKAKMVGTFYLLTLVAGGFFFLVGSKVGFVADVTAAMSYVAATALFYAANRGIKNRL